MKVLFLPWNEKNPYQQNLADGLADLDVVVVGCRPGKVFPVLGSLAKHGRPDVLHLHWISGYIVSRFHVWTILGSAFLLLELLLVRALGVRIVWTVHNLVEHKQRWIQFELRIAALVARLCNAMIVHCESGRGAVARAFGLDPQNPRTAVVPHGNYLRNYPQETTAEAARERLGITPDSFVYLFFGMIRPYKGIEQLIDAFGRLRNPRARLILVGTCRDAELDRAIRDAVSIDSRITTVQRYIAPQEVQYYMKAANAVVLPFSNVFTSGSAVLAMGFGRMLIVPRLGCLPEYVDARGGLLYEPGADGLRQALELACRSDWNGMGKFNRAVAEGLDWRRLASRTFDVYRGRPTERSPAIFALDSPARHLAEDETRSPEHGVHTASLP